MFATLQNKAVAARDTAVETLDKHVPPETRNEFFENAKQWISNNPKLSAFLGIHLALSGPPVLIFIFFAASALVSSLLTTLVLALTATFVITAAAVSLALIVLVPTLILTSIAATLAFAWGVIGAYAIHKFSTHPTTAPYAQEAKTRAISASEVFKQKALELQQRANQATNGQISKAENTLTDSAAAVRDYFGAADGSSAPYGTSTGVVHADKSRASLEPLVTPGGTLPRQRGYSSGAKQAVRPDLDNTKSPEYAIVANNTNGDVTPLDAFLTSDGVPQQTGGAYVGEVGSLRDGMITSVN